ncbi:ABC transporter ATP-binding protein [bacterium]|nr:ABC transporter ATP-binding protein [candidate division CSSED10-310 bacterium]
MTAETRWAVETHALTKRFGDFTAVDNVDLQVHKGEIFGFLGANGAGKTTTIRILCGLLRATSGQASVSGVNIMRHPEKVKPLLGYMSQKFSLYDDLRVIDNMIFFGGVYGLKWKPLKQRIDHVSGEIGLHHLLNRQVRGLPTGWKQRIALACAILHDPAIVFLDEPTGGVDPVSRRQFWDLIYGVADTGKTVFVTTHYMDEAEYCHRVAIMYQGRIVSCDTPHTIKAQSGDPTLEDAFIRLVSDRIRQEV